MIGQVVRFSGLQREVLGLYKKMLVTAQRKNLPPTTIDLIRSRFRARAQWPRRDVETIEGWLRNGYNQLEQMQNTQTQTVRVLSFRSGDLSRQAITKVDWSSFFSPCFGTFGFSCGCNLSVENTVLYINLPLICRRTPRSHSWWCVFARQTDLLHLLSHTEVFSNQCHHHKGNNLHDPPGPALRKSKRKGADYRVDEK